MKRYDPDTICPKCGCRELQSWHGGKPKKGHTTRLYGVAEGTKEEIELFKRRCIYEEQNSIELECWRCGYNLGRFWTLDVEKDFDGNLIKESNDG